MSPGDLPLTSPGAQASRLLHKPPTWTPPVPSRGEDRRTANLRTDWELLRRLVQAGGGYVAVDALAVATGVRAGVARGRLTRLRNAGLVERDTLGCYRLTGHAVRQLQ